MTARLPVLAVNDGHLSANDIFSTLHLAGQNPFGQMGKEEVNSVMLTDNHQHFQKLSELE